ncbi:diguanylate cyclase (GGDEF) domain-containing protein [Pseudidiomarina planktonica]|uniref:Diguanylate cyclase (GGDEF) domain-containing protein n=1 Tax=Pseudidiomarina planktonica TaxID=1323738 RepID=A0A1Y6EWA9_9GAMM|nr:bifunctional diguanylate cyclase/phosphodiesterase [Pseudidiomarina planktonica]RUO65098.1 GGDEF domain-containing protein [Pseudidiomarina planktonica]SMQ66499.1 diguanylate cyclase (GGDEF) domain-containing protein [Pseudidiomarina planktonica]
MAFFTKSTNTRDVSAERDSRTKLLSRNEFYRDVNPLISDGKLLIESLALMVIDIEGFDFILRTFGPGQRDNVIEQVSRRIQQLIGNDHVLYHITQDRFALIYCEVNLAEVEKMAAKLLQSLKDPFEVSGVAYNLDGYIGLSSFPDDASSVSELVRTAVFACDKARRVDGRYMLYEKHQDDKERERFYLLLDLEKALINDAEIEVAYQPQINLDTGKIYGVEALCRWRHPKHGIIPPGHFLPFVEHSPLMMPLTEKILRTSLADTADWDKLGFSGSLAVNLSTTLFGVPDMMDRFSELLDASPINANRIHFEITETSVMERRNRAVKILSELKSSGYGIAMDDFGTGHSSLAYISDLPIDTIKIDMHFVQNMDKPWGRAIVGAASALAENLNLRTCAEGIETEEQLKACEELGVSFGQGYFIGKPMFRTELEGWLKTNSAAGVA